MHPVRIVLAVTGVTRVNGAAAPAGWSTIVGMKPKTSIILGKDMVAAVEAIAARARAAMDARDAGIINAHADELNEEALDVLGYQVET